MNKATIIEGQIRINTLVKTLQEKKLISGGELNIKIGYLDAGLIGGCHFDRFGFANTISHVKYTGITISPKAFTAFKEKDGLLFIVAHELMHREQCLSNDTDLLKGHSPMFPDKAALRRSELKADLGAIKMLKSAGLLHPELEKFCLSRIVETAYKYNDHTQESIIKKIIKNRAIMLDLYTNEFYRTEGQGCLPITLIKTVSKFCKKDFSVVRDILQVNNLYL